jgi:hypothetical protein
MSILELQEKIKSKIETVKDEFELKKLLDQIEHLPQPISALNVRLHGSGKHIFGEMSDDFNEPLEDFEDYMR